MNEGKRDKNNYQEEENDREMRREETKVKNEEISD